jgi:glyoxylase-like metal-dependent hydrolase (beta-lactamase superfamily II)
MNRLGLLASIAVVLSFAAMALAAPVAPAADLPYGDIVRVAPSTLMVVGRPLAADKGEADVANAILYRSGDTLYVIDTGATPSFRSFLSEAIGRLRPFRHVVLINTHGHPDHWGNNALVAGLKGVSFRHYMSRRDFPLADHYLAMLTDSLATISGYVPGFDDPAAQAKALVDLFTPLEQSTSTRRAIESLPQRAVRIGRLRMRGWVFGTNDVAVLRTAGHTRGELVVYFPKTHLLHTADETVAYFPAWEESSTTGTRRTFVRLLEAASGDAVRILTDGHTFSVLRGRAQIRAHIRALLDAYDVFVGVVRGRLEAAGPQGATMSELIGAVTNAPELQAAPGGGQGGAFFVALQLLKELHQLHAISTGDTRATQRFSLPPS